MDRLITALVAFHLTWSGYLLAEEAIPAAKLDLFPDSGASHMLSGELTMVDHVNRMGILRPDRSDAHIKYHWDLPHHFTLLPYGMVYLFGSPATLRDVPIGTHLHGQLFLGPKGAYRVPLRDTEYSQKVANDPNEFSPDSRFSHALRLEDDFSFYQRHGAIWKIVSIDRKAQKLVIERVESIPAPTKPQGLSGQQTFEFTAATRVWKGHGFAELSDLKPGQSVLFNLTWATLFGPGRLTDIWMDSKSRGMATERQNRLFIQHLRARGFPARVDHVEHFERGSGEVTVSFYQGPRVSDFTHFREKTSGKLSVVEPNLRAFRQGTRLPTSVHYLAATKIDNPSPGHGGFSATFFVSELLEGIRPGRTIRLFPNGWEVSPLPREEELSPFDIRPRFLEVNPKGLDN